MSWKDTIVTCIGGVSKRYKRRRHLGASAGVLVAVRQARLRYYVLNIVWKFISYLMRVGSAVAPLTWDMEYRLYK